MNNIKSIALNSYSYLTKYVPIIMGDKTSRNIHNLNVIKYESQKNFEGKLSCGACCYVLNNYLKDYNIVTSCKKSEIFIDEYLFDHCYLVKDDIIIDPSYKQFFLDNKTDDNIYTQSIFNLPFVFVGNYTDLCELYNNLNNIHYKVYSRNLDFSIKDFWNNSEDISNILDMDKVLIDRNYAKSKGKLFYNLHLSSFVSS